MIPKALIKLETQATYRKIYMNLKLKEKGIILYQNQMVRIGQKRPATVGVLVGKLEGVPKLVYVFNHHQKSLKMLGLRTKT